MASLWELFVKVSGDNSHFKQSMRESHDELLKFDEFAEEIGNKLGKYLTFAAIGEGAIQAAKYVVFPIMAFVVAEGRSSRELVTLRTVVFWSSVCAIAVNLVVGLTGIANFTKKPVDN